VVHSVSLLLVSAVTDAYITWALSCVDAKDVEMEAANVKKICDNSTDPYLLVRRA